MKQMNTDVKAGKHYAQGVSNVSEWIHRGLGEQYSLTMKDMKGMKEIQIVSGLQRGLPQ